MSHYVSPELEARWAAENLLANLTKALFCLTTASRPYWEDLVAQDFFSLGEGDVVLHLDNPERCVGCGGAEGYFLPAGGRIALEDGLCQECDAPTLRPR